MSQTGTEGSCSLVWLSTSERGRKRVGESVWSLQGLDDTMLPSCSHWCSSVGRQGSLTGCYPPRLAVPSSVQPQHKDASDGQRTI